MTHVQKGLGSEGVLVQQGHMSGGGGTLYGVVHLIIGNGHMETPCGHILPDRHD